MRIPRPASPHSRRGVLLLLAIASLAALTVLMLSTAQRVRAASVASERIAAASGPSDDPLLLALARSLASHHRGQLGSGSSYQLTVPAPAGPALFRLDCERNESGELSLTCTPAEPADVIGLLSPEEAVR